MYKSSQESLLRSFDGEKTLGFRSSGDIIARKRTVSNLKCLIKTNLIVWWAGGMSWILQNSKKMKENLRNEFKPLPMEKQVKLWRCLSNCTVRKTEHFALLCWKQWLFYDCYYCKLSFQVIFSSHLTAKKSQRIN